MNPNNRFRLRDALLSVLAGNVFGATRTSGRILALKALYYLFSLRDLGTSWTAWRSRRRAIRERQEQRLGARDRELETRESQAVDSNPGP
jgi:hypothetical protein